MLSKETQPPVLSQPIKLPSAVVSTGTAIPRKTISVKNFQAQQKKEQNVFEALEVNESETFSAEKLEKVWDEYLNRLMQQKKMSWYTMVKRNIPKVNDNLLIEFVLDHKGQELEFNEFRADFLTFLRQELQNGKIQMEAVVRQDNKAKIPVTSSEKLEELMKKNPTLKKLTALLGLEISM